jgi:hypothetical protein
MNLTRTIKDLENVYSEKVTFPPKGTFELAKGAKQIKKAFISKPSGPAEAEGVMEISDPAKLKGKETFQGTEKFSSQNFTENNEKIEQKNINNFMSKSIFDKLFEDVMGVDGADTEAKDALDLGVGAEAEAVAEEGDVTITLSRDMAKKLHDVLMGVLGAEGEAEGESEDAEGHSDHDKESEEAEGYGKDANHMAGEATELTEVKPAAGLSLTGKNNKVGDETGKLVAKGGGDGKVKSEVDGKGTDEGHALVGSGVKGGAPTSPKGKANVVAGKASHVGSYLFQK